MKSPILSLVLGLCRRNSCMTSRLKVAVVLMLATSLALPPTTFYLTLKALAAGPQSSNSKCAEDPADPGAIQCTCDPADSSPQKLTATISEDKTRMQLLCKTGMTFAPAALEESMVCPAGTEDLCECEKPPVKEGTPCFPISDLFSGEDSKVQWTPDKSKSDQNTDKTMFLRIPKENLPHRQEKFMVGCLQKTEKKCQITVTIEARKTVMQERKVMCAYGKDSNNSKQHQTITLTPSQNSFTLVCGADGDVLPADYNSHYCPVTETPTDAQASCSGNYESIFPAYNSNWWKPSEPKSFTFEVPADQFPEKDATISLGCRQKPSGDVNGHKTVSDVAETSVCNVDVTVEGTGAASSSSPCLSALMPFLSSLFGVVSVCMAFSD
ncbi:SAG-related sequence [Besnoitia besnoiti]|uniref:SAG-related sequence n=1 Tax=Besnoitia besnoiti TaxID=94643 RepID=A0A2A9MFX4_BESBE|nr:SAG-related sequence [Besnoitia besnoiti]PFH36829.1 SAG-related sequence [Besnoitia besnoiti]